MERICPLLGLAVDRRTVVDGPDAGHRCHASHLLEPVDRGRQLQLCLGDAYVRCERFREHLESFGDPRLTSLAAGGRFVPTRLVVAPEPAWPVLKGRRRPRKARMAGAGAAVVLAAGAVAAVASGAVGPDALAAAFGSAAPSRSPSEETLSSAASPRAIATEMVAPSRSATPAPTALPTPTATAMATPSPTETPLPSATAPPSQAPAPAPTPPPTRTYAVVSGDTLSSIAAQFGTTVEALMDANGIEDADHIEEGQVLVIP